MGYYKKLEGSRLFLSPIDIKDAEKYTQWMNDLEIGLYLTSASGIYTYEKEKEILERISKEGHNFAIVDSQKEQVIGNCGLHNLDLINKKAELGIFIGDRDYWSKGYGKEAIELLLGYAFNLLNLNSIMLIVKEYNHRAIRCYEKCGFKLIGQRREAVILGDKKFDEYYMDILASEFISNIITKII